MTEPPDNIPTLVRLPPIVRQPVNVSVEKIDGVWQVAVNGIQVLITDDGLLVMPPDVAMDLSKALHQQAARANARAGT
jgi:hypothetical protein